MRERVIEGYLRDRVKELGGLTYKFVSPGNAGVPDRIVLLPGGFVMFVELKAPGKKPSKMQRFQMNRIKNLGHNVGVIDSKELVDELINHISEHIIESR